jgi:hypothetical protein
VVANGSAGTLTLLFGNGDGTFQPAATISSGELYALAIGDFNRDGKADIAEANWGVYVLLGNGNGTFQSALSYAPYYSPALSVGDLNADGKRTSSWRTKPAAWMRFWATAMEPFNPTCITPRVPRPHGWVSRM